MRRPGRIDIDQVGDGRDRSEPGSANKRSEAEVRDRTSDQQSEECGHIPARNLLSRHPPVAETADLPAPEPTRPLPRLFPVGRQLRDGHRRQTHHLPLLIDGLLQGEGLVELGDELEVVDPEGGLDGWMKRERGRENERWRKGRTSGVTCRRMV
jgi:hypothetical protein